MMSVHVPETGVDVEPSGHTAGRVRPVEFWVAVACAGGMALGAIGPWATVLFASLSGTSGDGVFVFGAALAAAVALFRFERGGRGVVLAVVAGLVGLGVSGYHLVNFAGAQGVQIGWGLYLAVAASAGLTRAAWQLRAAGRISAETPSITEKDAPQESPRWRPKFGNSSPLMLLGIGTMLLVVVLLFAARG